jgi:phosphoribosylanthranilate isomerase
MSVQVKICGITTPEALDAAIEGEAAFVGFVFYPPSRRAIDPEAAAELVKKLPKHIKAGGLFVNPTDEALQKVLSKVPLDMIQLHGSETPERVASVRNLTKKEIIKAISLAAERDLVSVHSYEAAADYLLFDTKTGPIPTGGSGQSFDWTLLAGKNFKKPWLLAGGIHRGNVARAVAITGAKIVDLSSGVEDANGRKDPSEIKAFLALAATLRQDP